MSTSASFDSMWKYLPKNLKSLIKKLINTPKIYFLEKTLWLVVFCYHKIFEKCYSKLIKNYIHVVSQSAVSKFLYNTVTNKNTGLEVLLINKLMKEVISVTMWKGIVIDKKPFFITTNCINKKWKVVLVNLEEIWIQNLSHEEAVEKCQLLNPFLDVDNLNLDEIINEIMENIMNHTVFVSVNEIKLQKEIEGGVFKFAINLTKGNLQDIWEEIIKPLCINAHELQQQNEIVIKEIQKKDEEITEYKLNGKLLRKEIETERFDYNSLSNTKINIETSSFFSMVHSLMNQNDHLIIKNPSNSNEHQIKKVEHVEENKNNSNNAIETTSIDENFAINDNHGKKELFITPETEIIEIADEVSKKNSETVNLDPCKSKKLDKQPKESTNKKRPRKELSHFIS